MEKKASGSVFGAMLLITGSCVGAGMLALPITTGLSGFFPALLMFLVAWSFMLLSAFLLLEINGWFKHRVNIISMAGHSLGQLGRSLSWMLYLFLFYALSIAYISGSGSLVSTFFATFLGTALPNWIANCFFVLLFGTVVYLGTRHVDLWNRVLMGGKIAAFLGLVFLGARYIKSDLLLRTDPSYAIFSLPILIIAFGFHNMIPSIMSYLNHDIKRVKKAIWGGSLLALVIYLIWEILVLGIVPLEGDAGIIQSLKADREASQALSGVLRLTWISSFAQVLAFFAILTSFLAQSLGLVHFLADGLRIKREAHRESLGLCALALGPPLILAIIYPQVFFTALNFAGGICANILFGFLPALIVWLGRKHHESAEQILFYKVGGGKPLLIGIILMSLFILILQLGNMWGYTLLPK